MLCLISFLSMKKKNDTVIGLSTYSSVHYFIVLFFHLSCMIACTCTRESMGLRTNVCIVGKGRYIM